MKLITLTLSIVGLLLTTACTNGNKTADTKDTEIQSPVSIPNVFPEKGLTDPHTIIHNGRLYVFCGHDKSWDTDNTWIMDRWEIWSTDDLTDWQKESEIHPRDTYIGDLPNCFAGDIISRNGKYYWYFSNRNISTGVMVADSLTGPFKDALEKPLLPTDIIDGHPYDPEIYEEDGTYTIIFGAGHYYAATLADDMISLADKPEAIKVLDDEGNDMWTADKSCVFKRGSKYYLIWEHKYAMADKLKGPYQFMGESLKGGHCNVFQWDGQYYALLENKDISLFYRGVSLKPLNFHEDGTIIVPNDDSDFPAHGRQWDFNNSTMGWSTVSGTELEWNSSGSIKGSITNNTIIESSPWLYTNLENCTKMILKVKNNTNSTQAKISIASLSPKNEFWSNPVIYWEKEDNILINIKANTSDFQTITIDISKLANIEPMLQRVRIEPVIGAQDGNWEIEYISIE